jgi:hypothetical protein
MVAWELLWERHLYLHQESLQELQPLLTLSTSRAISSTLQLCNCQKWITLPNTGLTEVFLTISAQNEMRKFLRKHSCVEKLILLKRKYPHHHYGCNCCFLETSRQAIYYRFLRGCLQLGAFLDYCWFCHQESIHPNLFLIWKGISVSGIKSQERELSRYFP